MFRLEALYVAVKKMIFLSAQESKRKIYNDHQILYSSQGFI